jgi:hypothetical protein
MLGEMTDSTNRGLAFAIWESSFGIGQIVGPALGGLLAKPAENYPSLFGNIPLFKTYPYLLPCLVGSFFSIFGVCIGFFFLEETLSSRKRLSLDEESKFKPQDTSASLATLFPEISSIDIKDAVRVDTYTRNVSILSADVIRSIIAYASWAFLQVIFDEVFALFAVTPIEHGGLSFTASEVGFILSSLGIAQIISQIVCYPPLERILGLVKTFRLSCFLMIIFATILPFVNDAAKLLYNASDHSISFNSKVWIYVMLICVLSGRVVGCCLGYVSIMIIVNDSCLDTRNLGTVHGCGQVAAAFVRAIGPALGGYIWSWSLTSSFGFPLDCHFTHFFVAFLSLMTLFQSYWLTHNPNSGENECIHTNYSSIKEECE